MKRLGAVTCAISVACAALVRAQSPPPAPPTPGPEHKRLDYFAGRWSSESEMKPGPFGPGGKMIGTDTCEWFAGGFHLVCRSEGTGPMGAFKGLAIMGYNADEKVYTYYVIDNMGMTDLSRGTAAGDTWTWTSESRMMGKAVKGKFTIKELGPSAYTFKWEASVDGAPMAVFMEGRAKKAN